MQLSVPIFGYGLRTLLKITPSRWEDTGPHLSPMARGRSCRGTRSSRPRWLPHRPPLHSLCYGESGDMRNAARGHQIEQICCAVALHKRRAIPAICQVCNYFRTHAREPRHTPLRSSSRLSHAAHAPSILDAICQEPTPHFLHGAGVACAGCAVAVDGSEQEA